MVYAGLAMTVSDRVEEKIGMKPTEEDRDKLEKEMERWTVKHESVKSNNQVQRLVFKPTEPNCRPELTIMEKITNYRTAHGKA
ncbi:hypothetical protein MMC22_000160 [Lobaria immixta]|nr:hypothetical protein [Lobaria immixta]